MRFTSDKFWTDQSLFARQTSLWSRRDSRQCADAPRSQIAGNAFGDQLGMIVPALALAARSCRRPSYAIDLRQAPSHFSGDSFDDRVGQKIQAGALVAVFERQNDLSNLGLIRVRDHHATRIFDRILNLGLQYFFATVATNLAPTAVAPGACRTEQKIKGAFNVAESTHIVGVCPTTVFGDELV